MPGHTRCKGAIVRNNHVLVMRQTEHATGISY